MDISAFRASFWRQFNGKARNLVEPDHEDPAKAAQLDLCPDVEGMLSLKKQRLLNLAYGLLAPEEAYLEVGTYRGKSLLSAMIGNAARPTYACDNFSEFEGNSLSVTRGNLARYGLAEQVTFFNADFRGIYTPHHLQHRIGLYFYDGAHDRQSQHDAILLVEPFLADEALVLVDDWRYDVRDSHSYACAGTLAATAESKHDWQLLYELPARYNGDRGLWWNGVGVLSFRRIAAAPLDTPPDFGETNAA